MTRMSLLIASFCRRIAQRLRDRRMGRRIRRHDRRATRLRRRLGEHEAASENLVIESQARSIADLQQRLAAAGRSYEDLQQKLTLAEMALDFQIEVNARDRERVAWETANFSRMIEQAKNAGRLAGQPPASPVSQLLGGM